jgi:hypothetical protein
VLTGWRGCRKSQERHRNLLKSRKLRSLLLPELHNVHGLHLLALRHLLVPGQRSVEIRFITAWLLALWHFNSIKWHFKFSV